VGYRYLEQDMMRALLETGEPSARLHGARGLWELAAGTPAGGSVMEYPLYAALVHVAPVTVSRASLPVEWTGERTLSLTQLNPNPA